MGNIWSSDPLPSSEPENRDAPEFPPELHALVISQVTDIYELLTLRLVSRSFLAYTKDTHTLTHPTAGSFPHPRVLILFPRTQRCEIFWPWEYVPREEPEKVIIRSYSDLVVNLHRTKERLIVPELKERQRWGTLPGESLGVIGPVGVRGPHGPTGPTSWNVSRSWNLEAGVSAVFRQLIMKIPQGSSLLFVNPSAPIDATPLLYCFPGENGQDSTPPELQ